MVGTAGILGGWALQGYSAVGHCRDALRLGTAGTLYNWELQGHSALGTAGRLCGWQLQGHSAVGHCSDTWWLALQGHLVVGHCRDTLQMGTAGRLCGWALRGHLVAEHCRDTWWLGTAGTLCGWALQPGSGRRARTTLTLKSNNPTARVGNNSCIFMSYQEMLYNVQMLPPCQGRLLRERKNARTLPRPGRGLWAGSVEWHSTRGKQYGSVWHESSDKNHVRM